MIITPEPAADQLNTVLKPVGETCAECVRLSAESFRGEPARRGHADCDCQIIILRIDLPLPSWLAQILAMVAIAQDAADDDPNDTHDVNYYLRRYYPWLADGVPDSSELALSVETTSGGPESRTVPEILREVAGATTPLNRWQHILKRHHPNYGTARGDWRFTGMSSADIAKAIRDTILHAQHEEVNDHGTKIHYHRILPNGQEIKVVVDITKEPPAIWTAFPVTDPKDRRLT